MITHKPYPSDVSDAEWQFVVPYLCLLPEDAGQRVHNLRDVFDAARWLVRSGSPWRYLPKDFPPSSPCCVLSRVATPNLRPPSSSVARSRRPPRVAVEPATMGPSGRRARK